MSLFLGEGVVVQFKNKVKKGGLRVGLNTLRNGFAFLNKIHF